jgi:BirA family transcriptional regulator, biotin operon repressor / biotin---[acetyl-CoA-carboxylase] ligase
LIALAGKGLAEGTWLRAERQTAGRGRMGRNWQSPSGNLHASTLVRLRPTDPPPATLALVAAVALHEVAAAFAPDADLSIKWPNDLMAVESPSRLREGQGEGASSGAKLETGPPPAPPAGGRGGKLAGILLERAGDAIVLGIGVNLAFRPTDLTRAVTSLSELGATIDPAVFCDPLARAFAHWLGQWRGKGLNAIRTAWLSAAHPVGTALTVNLGDGSSIEGLFDGLDSDGALRLRLADGSVRAIHAGDVFLI